MKTVIFMALLIAGSAMASEAKSEYGLVSATFFDDKHVGMSYEHTFPGKSGNAYPPGVRIVGNGISLGIRADTAQKMAEKVYELLSNNNINYSEPIGETWHISLKDGLFTIGSKMDSKMSITLTNDETVEFVKNCINAERNATSYLHEILNGFIQDNGKLSSDPLKDDEYIFEDYEFKWVLYNKNDKIFSIVKNPETVVIKVKTGIFGEGDLTPSEASQVAEILNSTESIYQEMKDLTVESSKKVTSGKTDIIYNWSPRDGFSIKISIKGKMFDAKLDRQSARAFSKIFPEAERMADFVKRKVDY